MAMRILLADDHGIVRQGVRVLLEQAGMVVVGEATDGPEALRLAHEHQPDVAVLDIAMPHLNSLETARRLREAVPETKIILLTMHTEEPYVLEALQAGTVGYVLKTQAAVDVVQAIREVMQGAIYLSPRIANRHSYRRGHLGRVDHVAAERYDCPVRHRACQRRNIFSQEASLWQLTLNSPLRSAWCTCFTI